MPTMNRRIWMKLASMGLGIGALQPMARADTLSPSNEWLDRFFFMGTWFYNESTSPAEQAALLNELGCPRLSRDIGGDPRRWEAFPELLGAMDNAGVELSAVYNVVEIDEGEPPAYLLELIEMLKGRSTLVWMALRSGEHGLSDPAGDEKASELLRTVCDAAGEAGLEVSLYPHFIFWLETLDDAIRLQERTGADNLGCTFNLYHWLKVEGPGDAGSLFAKTAEQLNCVTINGSHPNAKELAVEEGILPLGEGTYDVKDFLSAMQASGYRGPVGAQGYGLRGDIPGMMRDSWETWKRWGVSLGA